MVFNTVSIYPAVLSHLGRIANNIPQTQNHIDLEQIFLTPNRTPRGLVTAF